MAFQESSSGSSRRAHQWALLIGIDKYEQPHVPDLRGCVNDVLAVKRLLTDRFQVPEANIKVLTDENATRANILDAFERHVIAGAQTGDRVFIHYSGHGSQMKDVHGDEIDGKDETIVPHDSRDPQGNVFDITDDEIYDLLQRLKEKTDDIVIVFDCCHSGSASRVATTVRQIPMDERDPPAPTRTRAVTPQDHGPGGMLPAAEGYVLVSGCRADELSNEHTVQLRSGGETRFGALTYHLVQSLLDAPADVTWEDVIKEVAPEVSAIYGRQHPQIEGAIRRRVFTSEAREEDPAFLVTEIEAGTVTLNGGAAHGLQAGTKVAFYPEDAYRFAESTPIANGRITDVRTIESTADVDGTADVPAGARVRILSPSMPDLKLPVVLSEGADELQVHLQDDPWVRVVSADEARAPVVLRMRDTDTVGIDDATGEPLAKDIPRTNVALLLTRLKHLARFRALMQLHNPDPVSGLTRNVRLHFGLRGEQGEFVRPEHSAGGEPVVPIGEDLLLEVENLNDKPVYITILVLDRQEYSVAPLHPPPGAEDNKLAANDTFRLGTRGELRAQPPTGQTTVLLIATESPSDFRSLWTSQMRALDEITNPVERFFNRGLKRGLGLVEVDEETPTEDWTAKRATIHVIADA